MANVKKLKTPRDIEAFAFRLSAAGYLFMAVLGVTFSLLTRSEAIMLDGVYSLASFVTAMLAGRVARLVESPGSETFHFGYAQFEPLLNALRGLLILLICTFALFSSISALLHGGRPLSPGVAVIYGAGAAVGCGILAWTQHRYAKRVGSPLLAVDSRNWFVDGCISFGAGVTFLLAFILQKTHWSHLVPYVDPTLVTAMVLVLLRIPLLTVWQNLKEIMHVAPEPSFQEEVRKRVLSAVSELPVVGSEIRMVKIGRFFFVLSHVVLPADYSVNRIQDLDAVRRRITAALLDVPHRIIVDTVFTSEESWNSGFEDNTDGK